MDERFYRRYGVGIGELFAFRVQVETTDLYLRAASDLTVAARSAAVAARRLVEEEIARRPAFATALAPLPLPPGVSPPVAAMYRAGEKAGVGPMAAVAGTIAGAVGRALAPLSPTVMVENGGDLFVRGSAPVSVGLFAGASPFSGTLALKLAAPEEGVAVCTSSGTVGPSLSYGKADAATVISADEALADAVATALGNRVREGGDIDGALTWAMSIEGVRGALVILGDKLGAMGDIELERTAA